MKVTFFDKYKTDIEDILEITVEELLSKLTKKKPAHKIAFISSANSVGFMDGGSDLAYMKAIENIETTVRKGIALNTQCTTTGIPYLHIGDTMGFFMTDNVFFVCAPVMLLPQKVLDTDNQYYALKSALQLCKYVGIEEVYTPMMCTGWGGQDYKTSYKLMMKAVREYDNKEHLCKINIYTDSSNSYIYNMQTTKQRKYILEKQPKIKMNEEFGVKLD